MSVDIDALIQRLRAKAKEKRLVKKMALSLIDMGYRALAAKFHPDSGGSAEEMVRLSNARDLLKRAAQNFGPVSNRRR